VTPSASVLVVDDDPVAREMIAIQLAPEGHTVTLASSGREAIASLNAGAFDLVLCDVMMPAMDGFDVCRMIKSNREWRFVPVVLVTALDGQDDIVRGLDAGADDFLSKPVGGAILRARVRSMLRIRDHYAQLRSSTAQLPALMRTRCSELATAAALSDREIEVLDLLLLGRSHDEIAGELGVAPRTVRFHQDTVLSKLGVDSRMDLLRLFL